MWPANLNQLWARAVAEQLMLGGVESVVICPGSRSGPIALACAEERQLTTWPAIDERSAAFFALGLAKESGAAVGLVATSGTAGCNFYPAIAEASMARVPLVVLTADRPIELHGWGALQTIPQQDLYGKFARWFVDLGVPEPSPNSLRHLRATVARAVADATRHPSGPVHINAPFREPLAPTEERDERLIALERMERSRSPRLNPPLAHPNGEALAAVRSLIERSTRGLIVCGPRSLDGGFQQRVLGLARAAGYPVFAEASSQVRFGAEGEVVSLYDALLRHAGFAAANRPELILRFGGPLISKVLQSWLDNCGAEIVVFSEDGTLVDPEHSSSWVLEGSVSTVCEHLAQGLSRKSLAWKRGFLQAERRARAALEEAFASDQVLSEPRVARELVASLPPGTNLFVANSLPVRDLDAFAPAAQSIRVLTNRGANGIDGTISTASGVSASSRRPTVLLSGDLAFLHDLGGLMLARQHQLSLTIVLVNNDGGGIFSFLPIANFPDHFERLFGTPHGLDFSLAAALFGASHRQVQTPSEFRAALQQCLEGGLHVLEVRSERKLNLEHHRALQQRILQALGEEPWA
jgi:2-succinyl-5-enolpyruvyl-6-hydroxy-3-cyclohexene-1-carboxylate synthase